MKIKKRYILLAITLILDAIVFIVNHFILNIDLKINIGISLIVSFIGFAITFIFQLSDHLSSKSWPTITGKITSCEVKQKYISERIQYLPFIEYCFIIDGIEYKSNNISIFDSDRFIKEFDAEEVIRKYHDKPLNIYYNPKNPEESYLDRSGPSKVLNIAFYSILSLVIGFLLIFKLI